MKIKYQAVSVGAMLRDYTDVEYASEEHRRLVDIADSLYNLNIPVEQWQDNPEFDYKELYNRYGKEYWSMVLKDMSAIDSQLTPYNRDDLEDEYTHILNEMKG